MFKTSKLKAAALALAALAAGWSGTAQAQAATCGITGSATSTPAVYDPFNPNSAVAHVQLNLFRTDPPGANGGKTAIVSFFLQSNSSIADGTQVIPTSAVVAGNVTFLPNKSIFYNFGSGGPFMGPSTSTTVPSGTNAYLKVDFTGNNSASDPVTVNFDIILPPQSNIAASTTLPLSAVFRCTTTGGGPQTDQAGFLPNAITFPVTVLSALRAYYAGTALDFGEIGDITTASLGATPQKTDPVNHVFVQSSGPYSVTLSSLNGFQLFKPGAAVPADKIPYQLRFLNRNVNGSSPNGGPNQTAINVNCGRAGYSGSLTGIGNALPIQATLLEGGAGKNPSPSYSDQLTITITPLIYTAPGEACGTYGL